jgi:F-type H+-transporting ATPase subunit epsilon
MRLVVTTPFAVLVDADGIRVIRARDPSGAFAVLPGHTDLITALSASVLSWRDGKGSEHYAAVRGGVLVASGGQLVRVATREAALGDDLAALEGRVVAEMASHERAAAAARQASGQLERALVYQAVHALDPKSRHRPFGPVETVAEKTGHE